MDAFTRFAVLDDSKLYFFDKNSSKEAHAIFKFTHTQATPPINVMQLSVVQLSVVQLSVMQLSVMQLSVVQLIGLVRFWMARL